MCTPEDPIEKRMALLETYLQECSKYELHYSTVRSGVVTFVFFVTVTFGVQSAFRVEGPATAFAGLGGVLLLLCCAVFFGVHFQRNTQAARQAQRWIGSVLAKHRDANPELDVKDADTAAKAILGHGGPARLIRNFIAGVDSRGASTPAGLTKARRKPGETISRLTILGAVLVFSVMLGLFWPRLVGSPLYVATPADDRAAFHDGVRVTVRPDGVTLLQPGVSELTVPLSRHERTRTLCLGTSADNARNACSETTGSGGR